MFLFFQQQHQHQQQQQQQQQQYMNVEKGSFSSQKMEIKIYDFEGKKSEKRKILFTVQ